MDYQRLGDHIREVNIRNRDLRVNNLQGVSISKAFMPSIANTIGTDMSTYKIVQRGQFAYGPVTSRNGDKVSIALLGDCDTAIISQAYTVFEVIDTDKLLPDYLMMWFRRPEFDRYARFHSHGSAREVFDWEEMCDVKLPVPPIERQREIVAEYETLTRCIHLNEQIIQKLEATAQALYRNTFVDNIDKQNLPPNRKMGTMGEICKCNSGYPFDGEKYTENLGITALRGENVTEQSLRWNIIKKYGGEVTERIKHYYLNAWDIVIGMDGSKVGKNWSFVYNNHLPLLLAQRVACLRTGAIEKQVFIYLTLRMEQFADYVSRVNTGSTILHISTSQIEDFPIPIPTNTQFERIKKEWVPMYEHICLKQQETEKLTQLQSLLLAKMGQS